MTKFEELEETHAELKLKQTLWDSSIEWTVNHEEWMNVRSSLECFDLHVCVSKRLELHIFTLGYSSSCSMMKVFMYITSREKNVDNLVDKLLTSGTFVP